MPKAPRKTPEGRRGSRSGDERAALLRRLAELEEREAHARHIVQMAGVSIWEEDFSGVQELLLELRRQGVGDVRAWCATHPDFVHEAMGRVRVVSVNDATLRMVGASSQEELLGSVERIFLPESVRVFIEQLVALAEGRPFLQAESVVRTLEGRRLEVLSTFSWDAVVGRADRVLVTLMDIGERKAAERALQESEARFRNMADHAPVMMWMTDPEGGCTYLNRQWYAFTGQTEETGLGFGWLSAVHPEDAAPVKAVFVDANARRAPFQLDYRLRRVDGEYRWAIDAAAPRFGPGGEFLGYIGSVIDITERRRREELQRFLAEAGTALASSLEYGTTLSTLARLAVPTLADWCMVDLLEEDGSVRRVEVVSADPSEALLAEQLRRFPARPDGNPHHPPSLVILQGRPVLLPELPTGRFSTLAHDEEHARTIAATRPVSLMSVPLLARGRTLGALTFFTTARSGRRYGAVELEAAEDLGRRAALAVDNARLYRDAQRAVRLRDEFLSIASHELKTPLTPLVLKLRVLARELEARCEPVLSRRLLGHLEVSRRQVKRLSELVDGLLDVSHLSAGRLRIEREVVDLSALVREVAARFQEESERSGSPLRMEADGPVVGQWDRQRLEQAVSNLLSNALKYGGGHPVSIRVEDIGEWARLVVRDEGIGIEPDVLPRIFHKFERGVSERHYGGLGLGLYVTQQVLQAMGGTISAESTPGHGATFTVDLPLAPAPEAL
ncbi:PAS domain S-box-containing protein [Archangium gephyra]|uniref:histidine kinase n=1 Tax=Archangium gephyra TaxID=48 RepID=A0AAC8QGU3_9BACT|nr:ATP-binding protein [Archangium gephyra]AKJ07225.1 Chemotaxis protein methyltransferase CheR [Archangium gephyra]REG26634.1 PAS domain S-box-containing protein [Archangium gephyra]